jgi:hypothetical protein
VLAAYDPVEQPASGAGDTAAERVGRILDLAGWPVQLRDVTAGGVTLKSSTMADAIWTQLLQVADTDLALLWVRRDGRLAFRPEGRVGVGNDLAARLVICPPDTPVPGVTSIPVVTIGGAQFSDIRNVVSVSRQKEEGGAEAATVTVRDDASAARYLRRSYSRTDLQHQSEEWSSTVANAILGSSAWPSRAPRGAELSSRLDEVSVPAMLLTLEPDMTFDVEDTSGTLWREGCVGWRVTVGRHRIEGTVELVDMSKWVGAKWDAELWDSGRWSYAVTVPTQEEEK